MDCFKATLVLLLLLMHAMTIPEEKLTKSAVYKHDGRMCIMCDQGKYVVEHCLESGQQSLCATCPNGTYATENNQAEKCSKCKTECIENEVIKKNCTAMNDLLCVCQEGYGKEKYDDTEEGYDCLECAKKGKLSVIQEERGKMVRLCMPKCSQEGTYRNVTTGECLPCTVCADLDLGQITDKNCTADANTVCKLGPTDPGPTDPGPTDPGPTDPGPTDPGSDGDSGKGLSPPVYVWIIVSVTIPGALIAYIVYWRMRSRKKGNYDLAKLDAEAVKLQDVEVDVEN